jgi:hypothetical protein
MPDSAVEEPTPAPVDADIDVIDEMVEVDVVEIDVVDVDAGGGSEEGT